MPISTLAYLGAKGNLTVLLWPGVKRSTRW